MTRIDVTFSHELNLLVEAAIEAGVFKGSSDAARTVLRAYFAANETERDRIVDYLLNSNQIDVADAARLCNTDPASITERRETRDQ